MEGNMAAKKHVIDVEDGMPVELDLDPAIGEFIILKARAFDGKVAPVEPDPGSNAIDDEERGIIEDYPEDETETELRDAIEGLSDDAAYDLVAVFWIGRGDYTGAEWEEARAAAVERGGVDIAGYLMGDPSLGDFLEEGFIALGYRPQDYGPD
jgi:hypothetical protein